MRTVMMNDVIMTRMQRDDGKSKNNDLLAALPTDVAELQTLTFSLQQKLEQQTQFIEQLLEQIRLARHQHFGPRSERFSPDQMALAFNEAEATVAAEADNQPAQDNSDTVVVPAHRRTRGGRRRGPSSAWG